MKKKITIAVSLLLTVVTLSAQLVPNPQFEVTRPTSDEYTYQNPQMEKYQKGCLENLFRYTPAQNWTMWLGGTTNAAGVMTELVKDGSNCTWERLEITKSGTEACSQIILYSKDGDVEFYVDAISIVKI